MRVIDISIMPAEGIVGTLGLWYSWQKCGEILFFYFYNEISKMGIICDINQLWICIAKIYAPLEAPQICC
jgi:hypothetical protein